MPEKIVTYQAELLCTDPLWWHFNVYMVMAGYDRDGEMTGFDHLSDRVRELEPGHGVSAKTDENYDAQRTLFLEGAPCAYAEIYVYAVTNRFPSSDAIKDSPPFDVELRVHADGRLIESRTWEVNQWGGLTIVAHRLEA